MITRSDLVRAFARSDGDLEQEIEDVLHRLWIEPGSVIVSVRDGEARSGVVDSALDVELLVRAAERVPGVLRVQHGLTPSER